MTKIRLRPLASKDVPGMLEWMHDPAINRFFRFRAEEMTEEKALRFIENSQTETTRHYAVADAETDEYLGTFSLEKIDPENRNAMIAAGMRACAQGTGAAAEAIRELLRMSFRELGLERIYINVLADNHRCVRFCEKMGFQYEGCFRHHLLLEDGWHDWVWMAILKEDYERRTD